MRAEDLVAEALDVRVETVTDETAFHSVGAWDSLGHVKLMVVLERAVGFRIDDDLVTELVTVPAVRRFLRERCRPPGPPQADPAPVRRGLAGVVVDRSSITDVDQAAGRLRYRGYDVAELARRTSYEQVVHLLLYGDLTSPGRERDLLRTIAAGRVLPTGALAVVTALRDAHPLVALRTGISALGATADGDRPDPARMIGRVHALVTAHHRLRHGLDPAGTDGLDPMPGCAAFLSRGLGHPVAGPAARALESLLVVHADHDSNASTFAARVAVGCRAGPVSGLTAALAAFLGPAHGGALEDVGRLLASGPVPSSARSVVEDAIGRGRNLPGFGHRVYRGVDPRVGPLRAIAAELAESGAGDADLRVADALVEAAHPYASYGFTPNVDLYTAVVLRMLEVPVDAFGAVFAAGRVAGWLAHISEQAADNVLIRPRHAYVGPGPRAVPAGHPRAAARDAAARPAVGTAAWRP